MKGFDWWVKRRLMIGCQSLEIFLRGNVQYSGKDFSAILHHVIHHVSYHRHKPPVETILVTLAAAFVSSFRNQFANTPFKQTAWYPQ